MLSPGGHIRASSDRTFYDRTFSKLGKGSVRGSIFSLCASAIGSGVLSLPYVLKLCGYIEGTLFMILGATAAQVSLKMLAGLACDHNLPNYSQIAIKACDGKQTLNYILSAMIMLFMFGSCISYQIIISTLLQYVFDQFGMDHDYVYSKEFVIIQSVPTALLVLFPLSIKRDMSAFRYVSIASIVGLLYTGIVMAIDLPEYYKANIDTAEKAAFYFDMNMFTGCSMTFFAFQC